jgi:hypothetical protein
MEDTMNAIIIAAFLTISCLTTSLAHAAATDSRGWPG